MRETLYYTGSSTASRPVARSGLKELAGFGSRRIEAFDGREAEKLSPSTDFDVYSHSNGT